MELHVFGGERETETHTGTRLATARGGAAVEALEHRLTLCGWDSGPGVLDGDLLCRRAGES